MTNFTGLRLSDNVITDCTAQRFKNLSLFQFHQVRDSLLWNEIGFIVLSWEYFLTNMIFYEILRRTFKSTEWTHFFKNLAIIWVMFKKHFFNNHFLVTKWAITTFMLFKSLNWKSFWTSKSFISTIQSDWAY